jgi:hypothetical protein
MGQLDLWISFQNIDDLFNAHLHANRPLQEDMTVKNRKIDLKTLIYSKVKQKYNFVWRSAQYVAI